MFIEPEKPKPGLPPPQGLRRGRGYLFGYLREFAQHLVILPKAAVQWESGGLDSREANSNEWGEGSQSQGLGPTPAKP